MLPGINTIIGCFALFTFFRRLTQPCIIKPVNPTLPSCDYWHNRTLWQDFNVSLQTLNKLAPLHTNRKCLKILHKWEIPGLFLLYFRLFNTVDSKQMFDKSLPMTEFETQISGVGGDHSTNWSTTTAQYCISFRHITSYLMVLAMWPIVRPKRSPIFPKSCSKTV